MFDIRFKSALLHLLGIEDLLGVLSPALLVALRCQPIKGTNVLLGYLFGYLFPIVGCDLFSGLGEFGLEGDSLFAFLCFGSLAILNDLALELKPVQVEPFEVFLHLYHVLVSEADLSFVVSKAQHFRFQGVCFILILRHYVDPRVLGQPRQSEEEDSNIIHLDSLALLATQHAPHVVHQNALLLFALVGRLECGAHQSQQLLHAEVVESFDLLICLRILHLRQLHHSLVEFAVEFLQVIFLGSRCYLFRLHFALLELRLQSVLLTSLLLGRLLEKPVFDLLAFSVLLQFGRLLVNLGLETGLGFG